MAFAGGDTYSIVGSLNGGAGTFMNGASGAGSYPAGLPLLSMGRLHREDLTRPSLRLPGGMFTGSGGGWPGGAEPARTEDRANPQPLRMEDLLSIRLDQVTFDLSQPPYDSLQTYEFEGRDSRAESLSSLESDAEKDGGSAGATGATGGMDELNQKFRRLVEIIREREKEKKEGGGRGGGGDAPIAAAAEEATATVTTATHEPNEVTEKKERQKWDF